MTAASTSAIEVPVIVLAGLLETERRQFVLADNRFALNAGWDADMLGLEVKDPAASSRVNTSHRTGKVRNDDRADWSDAWALFPQASRLFASVQASTRSSSFNRAHCQTADEVALEKKKDDQRWQARK